MAERHGYRRRKERPQYQRMAHDIIDRCAVEDDHIEYKKSASDVVKGGILKTACAFANNYMNREIGLHFIGIAEEDDEAAGRKAVPVRPISGIDEAVIETTENELSRIGSPALVFEPDNDTDDYTAVTAYINGEFAEVKCFV